MHASRLLKLAAVLWIVWGAVHALAGTMVIGGDAAAGISAIADGVTIERDTYPEALGGILNQHGWNLLWFGVVTMVGAVWIWRDNRTAIWVTALVGGLADLGYFLFLDLAGYVSFVPGTLMTLISTAAIVCSGIALWVQRAKGTH